MCSDSNFALIILHICPVEREGAAQRKYEEDLRRRNMSPTLSGGVVMSSSGGGALSTGMTTSRHVTSGNDGRGDFSEVVEEKG